MTPSVTIRDLAARLGISHSTVSRALGDHPAISERTREAVRSTAEAMGYVPNAPARAMRAARSTLVGLLIPDIQNEFYAQVARVLTDSLAASGHQLALSVTEDDPQRELRDVTAFRAARVACVVIVPSAAPRAATLRLLDAMATVQLGRTSPGIDASAVLMDDAAGTRLATEHLIGLGHRRIGFIGGSRSLSSHRDRWRGFAAALASAGLAGDRALVHLGTPRPAVGRAAIEDLQRGRKRATALVLGSSELTLGALEGLAARGLQWPDELSIVGYGDPTWFGLIGPGITTIRLPTAAVANATAALVGRMNGGSMAGRAPRRVVERFTPTLVVRGSTRAAGARRIESSS
ncbi:MAG: LacI family DNA-binding transcriptional regulator [Burkholderiales bacterium]|nr:LacI family DNA-binding transcriptional regulator [Burkholderiales bacterium]